MTVNDRQATKLIYFQLFYIAFVFLLISVGVPSQVTYFADVINMILVFYMLAAKRKVLAPIGAEYIKTLVFVFSFSLLAGIIINFVPVQLIIWSFRNLFRGIFFFFACIFFLQKADIKKIFNILFWLQLINVAVSLFQYFQLGYKHDLLGGIFGFISGCNAFSNVLFMMLMTYYCAGYINKQEPFRKLLIVALSTMLLAALAEIKVYYVEFVLIIILCVFFSKPSFKSIGIIAIALLSIIIGFGVYQAVFPSSYAMLMDYQRIIDYGYVQNGGYNISRLGAFGTITDLFFHGNWLYMLFGLGFGACEMSSASSFLVSDFYSQYGGYNYRWFAHMMLYLQTGYVGFILFNLIFVGIFLYAFSKKRGSRDASIVSISVFTQVFAILTIANIWYNQAILSEAQYMIYFGLSSCFVMQKATVKKQISAI